MKAAKETLRRGRNGSVSVYLAGIMAAVIMFMGTLIDLARIAAFERLAESSVYAGVRSALSAYDGGLYARYGLFGRGGSDGDAIFARVVQSHLSPGDREDGWTLLRPRLESSRLLAGDALGRHAVLERQILEETKYKAPADFAMELAERFKPLSGGMTEAASTVRTLEELRRLHDSRQRHLEDALRFQKEAAAAAAGAGLDGLLPYPTGLAADGTAAGAAAQYAAYVGWVEADASAEQGEEPQHAAEIDAYASMARGVSEGMRDAARAALAGHERLIRAAREAVASAEAVNNRMAAAIRQAGSEAAGSGGGRPGRTAAARAPAAYGTGGPAPAEFRQMREEAQSIVLERSWFDRYRQELQTQEADMARIHATAGYFASAVSGALAAPSPSRAASLAEGSATVQRAYGEYAERYVSPGSAAAARERLILALDGHAAQRAELERQAEGKRAEAGAFLRRFGLLPRTAEAEQGFERLRALYQANRDMNDASGSSRAEPGVPESDGEENDGPSAYARDAMDTADGMFGGMADALNGFRNEFYLNEYAVSRFVSFQPQLFSGWANGQDAGGGTNVPGSRAGQASRASVETAADTAAALTVSNQETEYVIYGFHDPVSNLAAAFGELFALRVAIRTMEGLIECRALGHPLVVLAAAVVYGLEQALADMVKLVAGGTTPLSKWAPVDISYKDYLRLFLLLHGGRESKLSRIAALIEWNQGYRLYDIPAAVTGEAKMTVDLWFLPGIMKAVAASGILNGKVVDGRYETTVMAGSSY